MGWVPRFEWKLTHPAYQGQTTIDGDDHIEEDSSGGVGHRRMMQVDSNGPRLIEHVAK